MGEKMFGSQGTPEEIKKAEENLTEKQAIQSGEREKLSEGSLDQTGKNGRKQIGESLFEIHPITNYLVEETEKKIIRRKEDDPESDWGSQGYHVWKLLKGEEVYIDIYHGSGNEHTAILIRPDGTGVCEGWGGSHDDYKIEFSNWDASKIGGSEKDFVAELGDAYNFIQKVANLIPIDDLSKMGGVPGLVRSYLDVRAANYLYNNNKDASPRYEKDIKS